MIEMLVEGDRRVREPARPRNSVPQTRGGQVPVGGDGFVRLAISETGCSEAVAVTAVRLIVRRHRPQLGRLQGYLARFSPADRAHWVSRARWLDPAGAIGELAAGWGLSRSEASDSAEAGRARALAARAFARSERERVGGLGLLDAELDRLRASSPAAASVIASVGREFAAPHHSASLLSRANDDTGMPHGSDPGGPGGSGPGLPGGSGPGLPGGSRPVVPHGSDPGGPGGSGPGLPGGSRPVVPQRSDPGGPGGSGPGLPDGSRPVVPQGSGASGSGCSGASGGER